MSASQGRRVLVISYFFPPLGGAGVQRTLKHVRYLPEHGWHPTVVTTAGRWYPARDLSLLAEVPPSVRVLRARELPLAAMLRVAAYPLDRLDLSWATQVAGWPDEFAGWIPGALRHALGAVEQLRPDVIYSTAAPMSTHVVAATVSRKRQIPWVADFRDEWAHNAERGARPGWLRRREQRLERRLVEQASALTFAASYYRVEGADGRFRTITNGVDEADVGPLGSGSGGLRLRLVFVGTLYGGRDGAEIFAALRHLVSIGAVDGRDIEFRVVGNTWLSERLDVGPVELVQTGYVDHGTAVAEMGAADVLVSYLPPESFSTPGKIFEYLASGRPILSVAPEQSLAHRLVAELGAGWSVIPGDREGLRAALLEVHRRWRRGDLSTRPTVRARTLERFSRRRLAGELAEVFDDVVG